MTVTKRRVKTSVVAVCLMIGFSLCGWSQQSNDRPAHNEVFGLGEELSYKASFLGVTAGNATTHVNKSYHRILGNPCYKIDVFGETSSWLSWITRVKDLWVTYMDTTSLATRATYRKIREGNYRKDEWVTYLQEKKTASVQVMDKETEKYGDPRMYDIPTNATDIVGGFMHLRFFDLDHHKRGDTLAIHGFFEDASYTLKILYMGRQVLKTKFGKIPCHLLVPVMPDNKLFDGENSISVWISADKNKIPIRMSAKMFIGSTGVELIGFRGLKHSIKILMN